MYKFYFFCRETSILSFNTIAKLSFSQYFHKCVLIEEWSRVMVLFAFCHTTAKVQIQLTSCENVASDLGLGSGFPKVPQFPQNIYNWLVMI